MSKHPLIPAGTYKCRLISTDGPRELWKIIEGEHKGRTIHRHATWREHVAMLKIEQRSVADGTYNYASHTKGV